MRQQFAGHRLQQHLSTWPPKVCRILALVQFYKFRAIILPACGVDQHDTYLKLECAGINRDAGYLPSSHHTTWS